MESHDEVGLEMSDRCLESWMAWSCNCGFWGSRRGPTEVAPSLIEAGISTGQLGEGWRRTNHLAKQGSSDWLERTREELMQVRRWIRWIGQQPARTVLAFVVITQAFGGVPARGNGVNGHRWGHYHDSGCANRANDDQPSGFNFQLAVSRRRRPGSGGGRKL